MKYLKYIFFVSLLALLASCAKDEEISIGSLKLEAEVTNISSTVVRIGLRTTHNDLDIDGIILYTKLANGKYQFVDNEWIYERNGIYFSIFEGLTPNTNYYFDFKIANNALDHKLIDSYLYGTLISDPSFTFTTDSTSNVKTKMTTVLQTGGKASIFLKLDNSDIKYGSYKFRSPDTNLIICYDPEGLYPVNDLIIECIRYTETCQYWDVTNLKQNTTYYVFANSDIVYEDVNNYYNSIQIPDAHLELTPNSFNTGMPSDSDIKATLRTEFLSDSTANLYVKLVNSEDQYNTYKLNGGYTTITIRSDYPTNDLNFKFNDAYYSDEDIMWTITNLKPNKTYQVFFTADVDLFMKDVEYRYPIKGAYLNVTPSSFTTP